MMVFLPICFNLYYLVLNRTVSLNRLIIECSIMIMVLTTPLPLLVGLGDFSKRGWTRHRVRVGDGYKEEVGVRKGIWVYKQEIPRKLNLK